MTNITEKIAIARDEWIEGQFKFYTKSNIEAEKSSVRMIWNKATEVILKLAREASGEFDEEEAKDAIETIGLPGPFAKRCVLDMFKHIHEQNAATIGALKLEIEELKEYKAMYEGLRK